MFKWVASLCMSLYAVLIIFGSEGYDQEKYARADQSVSADETKVTPTANAATGGAAMVKTSTATSDATARQDQATTLRAVALETTSLPTNTVEKAAVLTVPATENSADELRPTLVLQPADETGTETAAASQITPEIQAGPVGEIWTVTGNRVNLRSGASTRNGVIGQTVRGESAEIIEMLDNGWAKVYIIDTGIEAYISAKFLAPEQG